MHVTAILRAAHLNKVMHMSFFSGSLRVHFKPGYLPAFFAANALLLGGSLCAGKAEATEPATPAADLQDRLGEELMGTKALDENDAPSVDGVTEEDADTTNHSRTFLHDVESFLFGSSAEKTYFLTPQMRIIEPKLRIYFDTGNDDPDEVDAFDDGALVPTLNLVEIRWVRHVGDKPNQTLEQRAESGNENPWSWGIAAGAGVGMPAQDSEDGTTEASDAPVLLLSLGMFIEYDMMGMDKATREAILEQLSKNHGNLTTRDLVPTIGLEAGYAWAISADEGLEDIEDGAWYFGMIFHVPF